MNPKQIVICLLLLCIVFVGVFILKNTINKQKETFENYYLAQPTKCFSCENQLSTSQKFMGGPSKCFSCEKEIAESRGSGYSDLAQPTKCFSCEKQYHTV